MLRVDFNPSEIDERAAVVIFAPWNPDDQRCLCGHQFRTTRGRIPFAHDVCGKTFRVEEAPKDWDRVLVCPVAILSEIITFEKLLEAVYPFTFHRGPEFYPQDFATSIHLPSFDETCAASMTAWLITASTKFGDGDGSRLSIA